MTETADAAPPKKRSRPKTTGRYETRAELCENVWAMYLHSPAKQSHIAKAARVSETTVANILNTKEGYPAEPGEVEGSND